MATMTATKMLTYNNRRMLPGEDFEAKSLRDQKVLLASRKAKLKREQVEVPPPPPAVATRIAEATKEETNDELSKAREEYKRVAGKNAFHGWDVAELNKRIAEYQTS